MMWVCTMLVLVQAHAILRLPPSSSYIGLIAWPLLFLLVYVLHTSPYMPHCFISLCLSLGPGYHFSALLTPPRASRMLFNRISLLSPYAAQTAHSTCLAIASSLFLLHLGCQHPCCPSAYASPPSTPHRICACSCLSSHRTDFSLCSIPFISPTLIPCVSWKKKS